MARIYEKDIPEVIEALRQLLQAGTATILPGSDLSEEEITLLREHRRQKQLTLLKNKGIDIATTEALRA